MEQRIAVGEFKESHDHDYALEHVGEKDKKGF